jgi:hypothetical protein
MPTYGYGEDSSHNTPGRREAGVGGVPVYIQNCARLLLRDRKPII